MSEIFVVADFKANFSEVLHKVRQGEDVILGYGRKKEKIAVLVPYEKYRKAIAPAKPRTLGALQKRGRVVFEDNFKMTDLEFLGLNEKSSS
ncbi:MAG: type II toxin-antitoxin system Phd/YefM family antitoxin [Leptospiraceae bacterium]|nr:type II toxin-antitoxin system Phd/YefM family antitoxin [Leptospiraceae bacterium]MCB1202537.1 type II toxin-antitoxin system Phd/YefM family antitoxin [Leptospiraceae bacterium]